MVCGVVLVGKSMFVTSSHPHHRVTVNIVRVESSATEPTVFEIEIVVMSWSSSSLKRSNRLLIKIKKGYQ